MHLRYVVVLGLHRGGRVGLIALVAIVTALVPVDRGAADPTAVPTHGYLALVGALHEHSGYSDGYPGSTPATYFASARHFGLDFMGSSEHSDNAKLPVVLSEECLGAAIVTCIGGDPQKPLNALRKWPATFEYAQQASTGGFVGFRGFEWTSDRFGHVNVYFSKYDSNAKIDGGYLTMDAFWSWFLRSPALGGGADGLATFNHPGAKKLAVDGLSGFNWDDFRYRPAADLRMVGIELYNDTADYGEYYAHALDKGWHLGAIGAEDLGHRRSDDWGGPGWAKTVMLTTGRTAGAIRAAMVARRFYAVRDGTTRLDFTADGNVMGARLGRAAGAPVAIHASVNRPGATIDLVTSGGQVVQSAAGGTLDVVVPAVAAQRYYFVRVREGGGAVAYSSPIWVTTT